VTVEPTLHGERQVLDASALLRLYLADGPLLERLEEAADLLAELQRLPLRTMASMELCASVLQLSQVQRISVYDATYLALALRYGAILLTADQQLAGAAGRTGCGG
jgi:predicted nucleic acid-binding protein